MPKNEAALIALEEIISSFSVLTPPSELGWIEVDDDDDPLQFAEFSALICGESVKLTYLKNVEGIELTCDSVDQLHASVDAELQSRGFTSHEAKLAINNSDSLELAPALREHLHAIREVTH